MIKQENMKKLKFLLVAFVALCLSTTVQAQKTKTKTKTKQAVTSTYQCPMKCEGDKTYAKEGNCPVCNMKIKPVVKKEKPKNTTHKNNHS